MVTKRQIIKDNNLGEDVQKDNDDDDDDNVNRSHFTFLSFFFL